MKISDTPFFYFFKTAPYVLTTAPYLCEEKSEPLLPCPPL